MYVPLVWKYSNISCKPTYTHRREAAVSTLEMLSSLHSRRDSTTSNGKPPTVLQNHQPASRQMSTDDLARYSKSSKPIYSIADTEMILSYFINTS